MECEGDLEECQYHSWPLIAEYKKEKSPQKGLQGAEAGASSQLSQLYQHPGGGDAFWEECRVPQGSKVDAEITECDL